MLIIQCATRVGKIGSWAVVRLHREDSELLNSRGMVYIEGTLNGFPFAVPLEPDGKGGHWFRVSDANLQEGKLKFGDSVKLEFSESANWPEPELPPDFREALKGAALYTDTWQQLTPKAKWEWLRWIRSTKSDITRRKRIEVALDKLRQGLKRPCCFNSALCSVPEVCRNGVLLLEFSD